MERLVARYEAKMIEAGLVAPGTAVFGALDDVLYWNRSDPWTSVLEEVFAGLNISALLYARPASPYREILAYLAARSGGEIRPRDTETRTFLHDLPVADEPSAAAITAALARRKSVVLPDGAVVTFGTVTPEQAYIVFSSVCHAAYVKFLSDLLPVARTGTLPEGAAAVLAVVLPGLRAAPPRPSPLAPGPYETESAAHAAMIAAGRATVAAGLVDSYFGNLSYRLGDILHISQTTSSLDELEGCIDPCPLDGSSSASVTASSELTAHLRVVSETPYRAILHGHPKLSVVLSLDCTEDCEDREHCHIRCPRERFVGGVPVVPGEVGTGPHGLCHTLPPALAAHPGAIVYGHGVFTVGRDGFDEAFQRLWDVEQACRAEYLERIAPVL